MGTCRRLLLPRLQYSMRELIFTYSTVEMQLACQEDLQRCVLRGEAEALLAAGTAH